MSAQDPDDVLRLDWDDLSSAEVEQRAREISQARQVPLVREVGSAQEAALPWYRGRIAQLTLAGAVGGLLAWLFVELALPQFEGASDATASNIVFTVLIGLGIGLVLSVWEGLVNRSWAQMKRGLLRTGPALAVLTLIGGVIADQIYTPWMERIVRDLYDKALTLNWNEQQFLDALLSASHLPRGVAWAIIGLAAGLAVGVGSRSKQQMINGALGGLAGGLLGGAMFDFFPNGFAARGFGLMLTGIAIGLGIALVELATRQHWLEIISGGMAGKQFILHSSRSVVGSAPDCDVTLIKDPAIHPYHAVLAANGGSLEASPAAPAAVILVNGAPIGRRQLVDGDMIQLGQTSLRYRSKADEPVAAGPILG